MSGQTGVKKVANALVGSCGNFKMSKEIEEKLDNFTSIHDKIKNEIRERLESQGFKCEEEYPVEYDINNLNKVVGKLDLYCTGKNVNLAIEVKSSVIGNGKPKDLMQIYLYHWLLNRADKKSNVALLIYRNYKDSNLDANIQVGNDVSLKLPGKYVYVMVMNEGAVYQVIKPEDLSKELANGGYVISRDCEYCVNDSCPIVRLYK